MYALIALTAALFMQSVTSHPLEKRDVGVVLGLDVNDDGTSATTADGKPQLVCKGWSCNIKGELKHWITPKQIHCQRDTFKNDGGEWVWACDAELMKGCKFTGETTVACKNWPKDPINFIIPNTCQIQYELECSFLQAAQKRHEEATAGIRAAQVKMAATSDEKLGRLEAVLEANKAAADRDVQTFKDTARKFQKRNRDTTAEYKRMVDAKRAIQICEIKQKRASFTIGEKVSVRSINFFFVTST